MERRLFNWGKSSEINRCFICPKKIVPRILCIGSSTTYGSCISEKETYPMILREKLNFKYEVINAGKCGMVIEEMKNRIPDFKSVQPDLIILNCNYNDATDLIRKILMDKTKIGNTTIANIYISLPKVTIRNFFTHLMFRILFRILISFYRPVEIEKELLKQLEYYFDEKFSDFLEEFKGIKVIYINFPSYLQLTNWKKFAPHNHFWSRGFKNFCIKAYQESIAIENGLFKKICLEKEIDFLDLTSAFQGLNPDDYFIDAEHFNKSGNEIIAEEIKKYITNKIHEVNKMRPAFAELMKRYKDSDKKPVGVIIGVGNGINIMECISIAYCKEKISNIKLYLNDNYTYITSNFGGIGKGLYTKEQCEELKQTALTNLKPFEDRGIVEWISIPSPESAKLFEDNSLDYVYIDANHEYDAVMKDMIAWYPKVKKGEIFAGHDYCYETKYAINKFMQDNKLTFQHDLNTKDWWLFKDE